MNNPVTAIYENGVLRPLAPLNLPVYIWNSGLLRSFYPPYTCFCLSVVGNKKTLPTLPG